MILFLVWVADLDIFGRFSARFSSEIPSGARRCLVSSPKAANPSRRYPHGTIVPVRAAHTTAGAAAAGGGKAVAGFLLSGFLLALLGAILPAWGYDREAPDFTAAGNYFLSVAI